MSLFKDVIMSQKKVAIPAKSNFEEPKSFSERFLEWIEKRKLNKVEIKNNLNKIKLREYNIGITLFSGFSVLAALLITALIINPIGSLTVGLVVLNFPILCCSVYKLTEYILERKDYVDNIKQLLKEEEKDKKLEKDKTEELSVKDIAKKENKKIDTSKRDNIFKKAISHLHNKKESFEGPLVKEEKISLFSKLKNKVTTKVNNEKSGLIKKVMWCSLYGVLATAFAATTLIAATIATTIGLGIAIPVTTVLMAGTFISGSMFNSFKEELTNAGKENTLKLNEVVINAKEESLEKEPVVKNLKIYTPEKIASTNNIKTVTIRIPNIAEATDKKYRYVINGDDIITQKMVEKLIKKQTGEVVEPVEKTYHGNKKKVYTIFR